MSDAETPNAASATAQTPAPDEPDYPLPPATFESLVLMLQLEAAVHLGLLGFGEEREPHPPNLRGAQHAIDLLGVLLEKTKGNLSLEEERRLENSLTELRFRYVQAVAESGQPK
jgi:hypothetical protein